MQLSNIVRKQHLKQSHPYPQCRNSTRKVPRRSERRANRDAGQTRKTIVGVPPWGPTPRQRAFFLKKNA